MQAIRNAAPRVAERFHDLRLVNGVSSGLAVGIPVTGFDDRDP